MTGRERLLTALNGGTPDKIPVTLFIQSQGHFVTQLEPEADPWDFEFLQKRIVDYQRSLGVDVHVRMLFFNPHEPVFAFCNLLNVDQQTPHWQIATELEEKGNTKIYHHTITTPEGVLTQTFCVNEERPGIFMYGSTEPPFKTQEDLRIAMKYEPPYSQATREKMRKNVRIIKDYVGDDGIVSAWSSATLFNNCTGLIDQTDLYGLFLEDPEFYEELMAFAKKRVNDFNDALIDAGVDAICFSGNAAGGFVGNPCFESYILPHERECIAYAQRKGTPVIYHNCGRVMELIPSYKKLGVKNVEPFSPHPLGNGDLDALAQQLNGEFSVTSGVDQVNVIQHGTVEDVRRATLAALEKGRRFPSFILQNVDFLEFGTPLENVAEYARTALENR